MYIRSSRGLLNSALGLRFGCRDLGECCWVRAGNGNDWVIMKNSLVC